MKRRDAEFLEIIDDLLNNEDVLSMKGFIQHGDTSTYEHCLNVSYFAYLIAKKHHLDYKSVARAGLLHDLFLYDWHDHKQDEKGLFKMHGFVHAGFAYKNAKKITKLNDKEKDIILKHMWPLNIKLPKYKESWAVIIADKVCSTHEILEYRSRNKRVLYKSFNNVSALLLALILKI